MWWLCFISLVLGCVTGIFITRIAMRNKTAYGYFSMTEIDPENEPGCYSVHIQVPSNQRLLDKQSIVLLRDDSRK
jgi:hypothetical protein